MPAHQAERFIAETMRSVLEQSWSEFELVVLDNACSDRTAEIVRSFGDPRVRLEHSDALLPVAASWNRAVRCCRTEVVKLVCADDLLHPRCLELQVRALLADPTLALVAARRHLVDERGRLLVSGRGLRGLIGRHDSQEAIRRVVRHGGNPIGEPAAVLFRRTHFDAVGGFDQRFPFPMDLALWVRLLEHGGLLGLGQPLAGFRVSRSSLSGNASRDQYRQQRALTRTLTHSARWRVPARDLVVGRVAAPLARLRRVALFGFVRHRRSR